MIICTISATKDTIGVIDKNKFKLMKQDSIFINVGRANIVNQKDLIDYIQNPLNKLNCPDNACNIASLVTNIVELTGTPFLFNFPNKLDKVLFVASVYVILGAVNTYSFIYSNTDINIPAVMNLPPIGPNIASATAAAGKE